MKHKPVKRTLTRAEAHRLVIDHEDNFHAIDGFAQILLDLSSSEVMPKAQGHGLYRLGVAIQKQCEILSELHSQLFHGLYGEEAEAVEAKREAA